MATVGRFEELKIWIAARKLSREVYLLTQKGSFANDYALRNQINAATGSTMDNIAEGFERGGNKEFIQFLSYAKGSAGETRSQLARALDRDHIDQGEFETLTADSIELSKKIAGLMKYLKSSEMKGSKYIVKDAIETYNLNDHHLEP